MKHPCAHWKNDRCSKSLFGETPALKVCLLYCPSGEYSGEERTAKMIERFASVTIKSRPRPSVKKMGTFVAATVFGKRVSASISEQRQSTCSNCEFQSADPGGAPWCTICGCELSDADRQLRNLTRYKENLPHWGCKHPQRSQGEGWKR